MKKFLALVVVLSVGLFTIGGCGDTTKGAKDKGKDKPAVDKPADTGKDKPADKPAPPEDKPKDEK
jgi:predicted small secreted protein